MKRASLITLLLLSSLGALNSARAMDYPLPPAGSRLIGQNQTYTIQEGDNKLQTIARRFNTAAQVILETNNTIAPVNRYHDPVADAATRHAARGYCCEPR